MISSTSSSKPIRTPAKQVLPSVLNNFLQASYTFVFISSSGAINELTLVVNPEEYEQTDSSTSNVVLTAGDVFSDSFGPGLVNIRISGTFGQRPTVNGLPGSGQFEALKLRNLFRQYLDEINPITTPSPSKNMGAQLLFLNQKDNEFWQIELVGNFFTLKRSKNSPFLYRYDLNFVAMNRVTNSFIETLSFFSNIQSQITSVNSDTQQILTTSTFISKNIGTMMGLLSSSISPALFANAIFSPVFQLSASVGNFLSAGSQIINFPLQNLSNIIVGSNSVLNSVFNSIDGTYNSNLLVYNPTSNTFVPTINNDPRFTNLLVNTILNINEYQIYSNSFVKSFLKSDFSTQTIPLPDPTMDFVDLSQIQASSYYSVRRGDTIESIALITMGDSGLWKTLAEFNNLSYPYISNDFPKPEKTLSIGQQIAIPSIQNNPQTTGVSLSNNIVLGQFQLPPTSDSAFGEDLFLNPSGDINFTSSGDILTVSGISNLKQAIFLKLSINKGELLKHPDFGIQNLLGYRTVSLLSTVANSQLESTLLSDPRIASISSSKVSVNGDVLNYEASVIPKFNSTPVVLNGSFGG